MTQYQFALSIVRMLQEAGFVALFAGGCVRDQLLGKPAKDFDVATSAPPEQVEQLLGKRRCRGVGAAFGVMLALPPRGLDPIEIATFRKDGLYIDGRRPSTVEYSTPEEDAARRDFTINGLFLDPVRANAVVDYVGGLDDLKGGIIRAIGRPRDRFQEDKLRLLRAVRFTSTLGFHLDPATETAARELAHSISVVSQERIAEELRKMLRHPYRARAVELCETLGLAAEIVPEFPRTTPFIHATLKSLVSTVFETGFAAWGDEISPASLQTVCERLKLSNAEQDRILWIRETALMLTHFHEWPVARQKRFLAHEGAEESVALAEARDRATEILRNAEPGDLLTGSRYARHLLITLTRDEICPPMLVTGADLIAWGYQPGPQFKHQLEYLRDLQLEGRLLTREQGREILNGS